MKMLQNGIDIFYIDESHDRHVYVVTAMAIPFLRPSEGGPDLVWPEQFQAFKAWRKDVATGLNIPTRKELHGVKLAAGRGNFLKGKFNFHRPQAAKIYRALLGSLDFIPKESVMSVSADRGKSLYGNERLEAALYALFQRMRMQCSARKVNAMVFFDQGHPEYRKLYRQAQVFLSTGSNRGAWASGKPTKNMPLDMFIKDGNEKNSSVCYFTQVVDLIAYAAFLKRKGEEGELTDWQSENNLGSLYDELPSSILNTRVQRFGKGDAILRL